MSSFEGVPPAGSGLRPFGAEPATQSQAEPLVPNAGSVRIIPGPGVMTRGRAAYEADVRERPTYHDGKPRRHWNDLSDIARWSWEKNPYPLPCAPENAGDN